VLVSHHQSSRELGTVAGISNPSAGKHDVSGAGSDSDVPMTSVLLNRRKGCSFSTGIERESVSQASPAKRIFRSIIGAQGCFSLRRLE
jgi:hypothetical protein